MNPLPVTHTLYRIARPKGWCAVATARNKQTNEGNEWNSIGLGTTRISQTVTLLKLSVSRDEFMRSRGRQQNCRIDERCAMVWNSMYSHASMRDCTSIAHRRSNPTYFRAKHFIRNSAQSVFLPIRSNSSNAWNNSWRCYVFHLRCEITRSIRAYGHDDEKSCIKISYE